MYTVERVGYRDTQFERVYNVYEHKKACYSQFRQNLAHSVHQARDATENGVHCRGGLIARFLATELQVSPLVCADTYSGAQMSRYAGNVPTIPGQF